MSDFTLDDSTWAIRAVMKSVHSETDIENFNIPVDPAVNVPAGTKLSQTTSGAQSSYEVTFSFIDQCWLSVLTPGQFTFSKREYYLYDDQELQFTDMEDVTLGDLACGGYTYALEYV